MTLNDFSKMVQELDCLEFMGCDDFVMIDSAIVKNTDLHLYWIGNGVKLDWMICNENEVSTLLSLEQVCDILGPERLSQFFYYMNMM